MLTAPQARNTGYTDQNSVTVFVVGTVDVSSPWYTQAQSTHKRLPQGQSLDTYEAEIDSELITALFSHVPVRERATHKSPAATRSPKLIVHCSVEHDVQQCLRGRASCREN